MSSFILNIQAKGFQHDTRRRLAATNSPSKTPSMKPSSASPTTRLPSASPSVAPTTRGYFDYSCLHSNAWRTVGKYNSIFSTKTNVLTSAMGVISQGTANSWNVMYTGIPQYDQFVTAELVTALNSRPKSSTDFISGATTAVVGSTVEFGTNIGYTTSSCSLGYWPPGPSCPSASNRTASFPLLPAWESSTGLCTVAIFFLVNCGWSYV